MSTEFTVNKDSLEFIFEHTKDAPAKQAARIDALDAKIIQVFGAASVILGFAAVTAVRDATAPLDWALVAGSLAAYAIIAVSTAFALWPRRWLDNTHAVWLWAECYHRPPEEIRHILLDHLKEVTKHNDERLTSKAWAIRIALAATGVEVGLMIASVITAAV